MNTNRSLISRTFLFDQSKLKYLRKFARTSFLSNDEKNSILDGLASTTRWKKGQITKITSKFQPLSSTDTSYMDPINIENYEDIQPMWRDMESRVTRRKTFTVEEAARHGKGIGRRNVRKTDEEAWLQAGLYDDGVSK